MPNIKPKDDPYNHLFSIFVKDDSINVKRETIILTNSNKGQGLYNWRCMVCLKTGHGDYEVIQLAVELHKLECKGDKIVAASRVDLLEAISNASEELYSAGWLEGIERILLTKGGMWTILAQHLGWPVGYMGEKGWETLDEALNRYKLTQKQIEQNIIQNLDKEESK